MEKKMVEMLGGNEVTSLEWEERKKFVNFTQEDVAFLKKMHFLSVAHGDEIIDALYSWLLSFEETKAFFKDPKVLEHVKQMQKQYFLSLTKGEYGDGYLRDRLMIGRVHRKVGLEPRWYMGTYSIYLGLMKAKVWTEFKSEPEIANKVLAALLKIFSLDQELAMTAYIAPVEKMMKLQEQEIFKNKLLAQAGRLAALSEMATGVAHELNQPLGIIQANMQTLELLTVEHLSSQNLAEITTSTIAQVNRATNIIERMRSFAKRKKETSEKIDILKPIESALKIFDMHVQTCKTQSECTTKAAECLIKVTCHFEKDLPSLNIDEQQMEQAIISLLSNAKDALEIRCKKALSEFEMKIELTVYYNIANHEVVFEMSDNGIGMTDDTFEHCLEPFFTTKEIGEGTGLGLSIVYNMVKTLGGQLDIISKLDQGTIIRLLFPVDKSVFYERN